MMGGRRKRKYRSGDRSCRTFPHGQGSGEKLRPDTDLAFRRRAQRQYRSAETAGSVPAPGLRQLIRRVRLVCNSKFLLQESFAELMGGRGPCTVPSVV